jgi:hypothetical protein
MSQKKQYKNVFSATYMPMAGQSWKMVKAIGHIHVHGLIFGGAMNGLKLAMVVVHCIACVTVYPAVAGLAWAGHTGFMKSRSYHQQRKLRKNVP